MACSVSGAAFRWAPNEQTGIKPKLGCLKAISFSRLGKFIDEFNNIELCSANCVPLGPKYSSHVSFVLNDINTCTQANGSSAATPHFCRSMQ